MPRIDYVPQLATLVDTPPSGDQWLHEIKFDGYRIGARVRHGAVTLHTRNGNDWTAAFPEIVSAVEALGLKDALIDGEAAVELPDGRTSFQALQNTASGDRRGTLAYFVFDLLRLEGESLEKLPLGERKARLKALVGRHKTGRIRFADHVQGNGERFFTQACHHGLEGIVSKRRDLPYRPGRHGDWLKTKCVRRQEFVVGGFTDPEGMRSGLGALLIGYYEGDRLVFCGKVGTGFTQKTAVDLRQRLDRLAQHTSPFTPPPAGPLGRRAHWVKPKLVCEVVFTEWTTDGKIRHPSYQGLRADKEPREIMREKPAPTRAAQRDAPVAKTARRQPSTARTPADRTATARTATRGSTQSPLVAGVAISHADRVVYPDVGLTKLEVARYYEQIGDLMLPHVTGRPLTLVRCPEGMSGGCFFMKHSKLWAPPALRRIQIKEKTKVGDYLIADDVAGLVSLAQMGVLEIHAWNCVEGDIERPDRLVFDLDPGEEVAWPAIVRAARMVRDGLAALKLESFVKTTGGRGLHVVVPLVPHAGWAECISFSRALSERFVETDPATYTTNFSKAGRTRKILIDFMRNNRGSTSICAYSTRARAGAPVSTPLVWDELTASARPQLFSMSTIGKRAARLKRDPWAGYWKSRQKLTQQLVRAIAVKP